MAKVLLVEDDDNLREIYEARLQAEGYDIVSAKDGEEALVVAKAERPDLIISDVMMPKISGFEMLDILRNTDGLKETRVIMLTALGQAEDQTRANSLGADRYLVKSQVTLEDIVKAASELLNDDGVATPQAAEAAAAAATAPAAVAASTPPAATPVAAAPVVDPVAPPTASVAEPAAEPVAPAVATPPAATDEITVPSISAAPVDAAVSATSVAEPAAAPAAEPTPEPAAPSEAPAAPAPETTAAPPEAAEVPNTDTTAQEQATVEAQIEEFVNKPVEAAPAAEESAEVSDDKLMNQVVNDLVDSAESKLSSEVEAVEVTPSVVAPTEPAPAPTPEPVAAAPATPEAEDTLGDSAPVAHKKVIQPIGNAEAKPSLNELLAQEDAKNIVATTPVSSDGPAVAPAAPDADAPTPPPPGHTVAPGGAPAMPKVDGFDPNQVAL